MSRARRPFGLRPRLALAWLAILWERLWRAFWPASCVAGLALALALFDVLPDLPGWLHALVLAALAAGFAAGLWHGARTLRLPRPGQATARIEERSALLHQPLATLEDEIALGRGEDGSEALWRAHRRRMHEQIKRLRVGLPAPGVAARDPWAVRAGLVLVLAVALVVSWGDQSVRLERALEPHFGAGTSTPAIAEMWITPPDYTGLAPRFLSSAETRDSTRQPGETVAVPVGSTVLARVSGGRGEPMLAIDGDEIPLESAGGGAWQVEMQVYDGTRVVMTQRGDTLAQWPVEIVPDTPPSIAFARDPEATPRSTLRIDFTAEDDYGIETVRAVIRRGDDNELTGEPIELRIPVTQGRDGRVESTSYHDLTAHPWAGMPVYIHLMATDGLDQRTRTERIPMFLPERKFTHPVARAIIEQRKQLIMDPERHEEVGTIMGHLADKPERFGGDMVVYLGLRYLRGQLRADGSEPTVDEAQNLMWDLALRIEDGNLSLAEQRLRAAQQALMEALERDASDEEIQALMDELERAMQEFLQSLAQEMQRNPEKFQNQTGLDPNAMELESRDLERMLDQIRELAESGSKAAAQQLLSQLQSMLENLQMQAQGQQPGDNPFSEMLGELGDLIERQERLMDETFGEAQRQEGTPYQERELPDTEGLAEDQQQLRRDLGELMRRMEEMTGNMPQQMGEAMEEMGRALRSLDQRDPGGAVDPQARALDALRQGGQQMVQQMMEQMGGQAQVGQDPGQRFGGEQDPFGRSMNNMGNLDTSDIEIPDKPDLQRAREILQELRRRAGERGRPTLELDYIERLLERF